ncbi:hypothetical protein E0Z10_g1261 [Xylaria hypoxylon]|uniref:Uncharacterized protein n=1 Tax=Xylaria hypoxylon TaxID=37992 RepID=A0A4Z0Z781_9PEZI|nr:hypothetical protein E0Z10_g1261 [Xylaria hypoxylon]
MCIYKKSIFLCNHTLLSAEPHAICSIQQEYLAGEASEPCDVSYTHSLSTIRISSRQCESCETKKTALDRRLLGVKEKMAELRQHLNESYGDCMKHVEDAGLKPEDEGDSKSEEDTRPKEVDPVEAFLTMKMKEEHAHLMILGSSQRK